MGDGLPLSGPLLPPRRPPVAPLERGKALPQKPPRAHEAEGLSPRLFVIFSRHHG